jgi:queuine tRNA-ribosyltransferase
MSENFSFNIQKKIPGSLGRSGVYHTPHGDIETPAFIVVGTKATVKGVTPDMVQQLGAQAVLANTYHLYLQPGDGLVKKAGGFPQMMGWSGPTFTDSGGFQVFSLGEAFGTKVSKVASGDEQSYSDRDEKNQHEKLADIDEEGVTFRSYLDGSEHRFTPERSMEIQWNLGADIIFAFDECTSPLAPESYQREAMDRTHRWAERCLERHHELDPENKQALFAVVQGGRHEELRKESARVLAEMELQNGAAFDGFGIGGSFNKDDMGTAVQWVNEILPEDKPRHLLGIGEPRDIFEGVENGCDTFDCVAATRVARTGTLYTKNGPINILNAQYREDFKPVDDCDCPVCSQGYTRAYLAHLFRAKEMMGPILASMHNLRFIIRLVDDIRSSIQSGTFDVFKKEFIENYYGKK